jgi:hypothetical protein
LHFGALANYECALCDRLPFRKAQKCDAAEAASGSRLPAEQTIRRGIVGSDNGNTQILGYLLDSVLANNGNPAGGGKNGYQFTSGTGTVFGTVNSGYTTFG